METRQLVLCHHILRDLQHGMEDCRYARSRLSFSRNVYEKDLRIISPTEIERCLGFPKDWTRADDSDIDTQVGRNRRRNAVGNAFAVPVITRILIAICACLETPKASAMNLWLDPSLPTPFYPDVLDDIFPEATKLASEFSDFSSGFDSFMGPTWQHSRIGPDPGAKWRLNRAQRAASLGVQQGTHLSRNGMRMLIPDDAPKGSMPTPKEHVRLAKLLEHPFQAPPDLPLDLQFAANASVPDITSVRKRRMQKAQRIGELADRADAMDTNIWDRMSKDVKVAAGSARLGLITILALMLRWPDWQMTSLYTRGFRVAGIVEPSNIFPSIGSKNEGTLHDLREVDTADAWNEK